MIDIHRGVTTKKMGVWEDIERSETYLVCCMFEDAASLSSSIISRLGENKFTEGIENNELNDISESAGMVLVQSLKELGRTLEILEELKRLFGSVITIPIQAFLTGVCFHITECPYGVREFLEEFLSKWRYMDERCHVLTSSESIVSYIEGCDTTFVVGVDKYMEVVEIYVVTLLGMVMNEMDLAISWVEKSALPGEKRQELLRQLRSIYSSKETSMCQPFLFPMLGDESKNRCDSLNAINIYEGSSKALGAQYPSNLENVAKQAILKFAGDRTRRFWWFRIITLKFGSGRLVISNGNILLGCLVFIMYYLMRRKQATLKRFLRRRALSMKKAVGDLWQLAFSYQVNPLAAVQPFPPTTRSQ